MGCRGVLRGRLMGWWVYKHDLHQAVPDGGFPHPTHPVCPSGGSSSGRAAPRSPRALIPRVACKTEQEKHSSRLNSFLSDPRRTKLESGGTLRATEGWHMVTGHSLVRARCCCCCRRGLIFFFTILICPRCDEMLIPCWVLTGVEPALGGDGAALLQPQLCCWEMLVGHGGRRCIRLQGIFQNLKFSCVCT